MTYMQDRFNQFIKEGFGGYAEYQRLPCWFFDEFNPSWEEEDVLSQSDFSNKRYALARVITKVDSPLKPDELIVIQREAADPIIISRQDGPWEQRKPKPGHSHFIRVPIKDIFQEATRRVIEQRGVRIAQETLSEIALPSPVTNIVLGYLGQWRPPSLEEEETAEGMKGVRLALFYTFSERSLQVHRDDYLHIPGGKYRLRINKNGPEEVRSFEKIAAITAQYLGTDIDRAAPMDLVFSDDVLINAGQVFADLKPVAPSKTQAPLLLAAPESSEKTPTPVQQPKAEEKPVPRSCFCRLKEKIKNWAHRAARFLS